MIVDFHSHIYPPSFELRREELCNADPTFGQLFSNSRSKMTSVEELITEMDENHVDVTVIMGIGWTDQNLAREANNYILESSQDYPGRLVGFCSVNPRWGEDALQEIKRCAQLGAKGVGELHPSTQQFDIGDVGTMAPLMNTSKDLNLVVLTHSSEPVGHSYPGKGDTTPEKLWAFIQNFPDNNIVCAHWGGGLPFYALMPEIGISMSNAYFDTAASPLLYKPAIFDAAANLLDANKILFGSDYPMLSQQRLLDQIERSHLSSHAKERILGRNAKDLLHI